MGKDTADRGVGNKTQSKFQVTLACHEGKS